MTKMKHSLMLLVNVSITYLGTSAKCSCGGGMIRRELGGCHIGGEVLPTFPPFLALARVLECPRLGTGPSKQSNKG